MNVSTLKEKLASGEPIKLLDVREREEFEHGDTIPGAEHMPMGQVFVQPMHGNLPKDQKIITLCKTGGRCEIVARELKQKGYNIEHLEGGIDAWNKEK